MDKNEILELLSECICIADENQIYTIGDKLFDVIIELKSQWGMNEE